MDHEGSNLRPQQCSCTCGHVTFNITDPPLFRLLCHCTICQRFNHAPFGDIVVYNAASVESPTPGSVSFDTYRPPPNLQRGKCAHCGDPAIERFEVPLLPKLIMVPMAMHHNDAAKTEPTAHVFYGSRVADADDSLPKHSGYLPSQLAFVKYLIAARLRAR